MIHYDNITVVGALTSSAVVATTSTADAYIENGEPLATKYLLETKRNVANGFLGLNGDGNAAGNFIPNRLTTAAVDALAGETGEIITVSDDPGTIRVMDGVTNGGGKIANGWAGHAEEWDFKKYRTIVIHHGGDRVAAGLRLTAAMQDAFNNGESPIRIICEPGEYVISEEAERISNGNDYSPPNVTLIMHGCKLISDGEAATASAMIFQNDEAGGIGENITLTIIGAEIVGFASGTPLIRSRGAYALTITTNFEDCTANTLYPVFAAQNYTFNSPAHVLRLKRCNMYVNTTGIQSNTVDVQHCPYVKIGDLGGPYGSPAHIITAKWSHVEFNALVLTPASSYKAEHCKTGGAQIRANNLVTLSHCHVLTSFADFDPDTFEYNVRTIKAVFCSKVQATWGTSCTNSVTPDNTVYSFTI